MAMSTRQTKSDEGTTVPPPSAAKALSYLTPDTQTSLASLHGAPRTVVDAVAQLLPLGSRAALEDWGIVAEVVLPDEPSLRYLKVTAFGYDVIAAAFISSKQHPERLEDWVLQYEQAVADCF